MNGQMEAKTVVGTGFWAVWPKGRPSQFRPVLRCLTGLREQFREYSALNRLPCCPIVTSALPWSKVAYAQNSSHA